MRAHGIIIIWVVCAAAVGCNSDFLLLTAHNFAQFPLLATDEVRMSCRNKLRAEEAWKLIAMGAEKEYSHDHAAGFKAGYADYLTNGGSGEPPAVPPYCYRTVKYQTPEGLEAIKQWYEGWKHGTMMARASGQRELEVIPLSAPPINVVNRFGEPVDQYSQPQPPTLSQPRVAPAELPQEK